MYPVAPACLILFVKRILDDPFFNVIDSKLFVCAQETILIDETHNRDDG